MMIVTKNPNKKGNKENKIIAALVVAIVAVLIFIAVMIAHFTGNNANEPVTEQTTQTEETVPEIVIENHITENTEGTKATEKEAEVLKLQEPETTKAATQKPTQQPTTSNGKTAEPVKPANPGSTPSKANEVVVDGNDSVKEYSCGVKGHHCDSKETHNFIVSLEQKGCPYCGSHSCKSFYTYDEWGNACYDPTKCESYSAKNDPCETCQECGKKVGDGSKGTCVRFNVDMKCPVCGKTVKAKTCHSH